MLQPHKPDTPSATPIRKSHFRKHRKKFDHAPVNFNKNTGPHHGINIVRGPGVKQPSTTIGRRRQRSDSICNSNTEQTQTAATSLPSSSNEKITSPTRTAKDSRTLYTRPRGQPTNNNNILEIPLSEMKKDENEIVKSNDFRSRLQKEEEQRKELRRAYLQGLSANKQARKQQQYDALIKAVSVGQEDSKFSYERGLLPGDLLFQFFAPRQKHNTDTGLEEKPPGKRRSRSLSQSKSAEVDKTSLKVNLKRLRMWIPDTVVYCGRDGPVWLYTHTDGYVYRSHSFDTSRLTRRLGTPKSPDNIVAVRKESIFVAVEEDHQSTFAKSTTSDSGPARELHVKARKKYTFDGNNTRVINTRELDDLVTQMGSRNDDNVFILQRYVECHGPQAFLIRSFYQRGKQPYAWMVSNRTHFDDPWDGDIKGRDNKKGGSINNGNGKKMSIPSSVLIARFCTDIHTPGACTFAHLRGRASKPTAELTDRIHQHLQRAIGRAIETLVCDYVRDRNGDLWLLQVKAFKFLTVHPPLQLSKNSRALYLHSQGGRNDLDEPIVKFLENDDHRVTSGGNSGDGGFDSKDSSENGEGDSTESSLNSFENKKKQQIVHRMIRCRFCMLPHVADDLAFTMTRKMIDDTETHLQARVSIHRFNKLFGGRESVAYSSAKSALYQPYHVCTLCYQLYQSEMKLKSAAFKFALSLCTDAGTAIGGGSLVDESKTLYEEQKIAYREHRHARRQSSVKVMDKMFGSTMGDLLSSVRADRFLGSSVTMYRLLLVFHAVHNLPEAILNDRSDNVKYTYFLRYMLNGHVVEIDLNIDEALDRNDSIVPIRALRLHYMFTSDSKTKRGKKQPRSIDTFISSCVNVRIQLMRCPEKSYKKMFGEEQNGSYSRSSVPRWHAEKLGEARLPLKQFKCDFVNKHDVFAPMGLELGMCSLRATIGLEQTRTGVDSSIMADDPGLREVNSVFVPSAGFHTTDPLPQDWFAVLREPINPQFEKSLTKVNLLEDTIEEYDSHNDDDSDDVDGVYDGEVDLTNDFQNQSLTFHRQRKWSTFQTASTKSPGADLIGRGIPTWCVTLQLHSLHNMSNVRSMSQDSVKNNLNNEALYCEYAMYGKKIRTPYINLKTVNEETQSTVVLNQTNNIYLCCTWENLQSFHGHYPTFKIDFYRCKLMEDQSNGKMPGIPVGTAYINLEELATQRSIDGTYDMICYEKKNLSITTQPPYLSASMFCVSVSKICSICYTVLLDNIFYFSFLNIDSFHFSFHLNVYTL
jgi:hypothetical protein